MRIFYVICSISSISVHAIQTTVSVLIASAIDLLRVVSVYTFKAFGAVMLCLGKLVLLIANRHQTIGR